MEVSRAIRADSGKFMLAGEVIGPNATDSKSRNLPSQPRREIQAMSISVGARSAKAAWPSPSARGNPSPHERPGLWQLEQERTREPERMGSKNSLRPSSAFASEYGFSSGKGISAGRR